MLNQAAILIAEDEPYIALAIQFAVEDAGGIVIGPAATVIDTLALLKTNRPSAAILDVNLADGDIFPVLERLVVIGLPIIIQSGAGLPPDLAARFPNVIAYIKPCAPEQLVYQISAMLAADQNLSTAAEYLDHL